LLTTNRRSHATSFGSSVVGTSHMQRIDRCVANRCHDGVLAELRRNVAADQLDQIHR
jgi:hypothetical protein